METRKLRRRLSWGAALIAAGIAVACVIIPIPTSEGPVVVGREVTEADLARIEIGRTTRDEVVALLGQPNVIWEDKRVFAYEWETSQGYLIVMVYGARDIGTPKIPRYRLMLVQFDANDRVTRFKRTGKPLLGRSYADILQDWVAEGGPTPAPAPPSGPAP